MNFPPGYGIRLGIFDPRTGRITHMTGSGGAGRGGLNAHNNSGGHGGFSREVQGGIGDRGGGFGECPGMGTGGGFRGFPGGGMGGGSMGRHTGGGRGRVVVNGRDLTDSMRVGGRYISGFPVGLPTGPGFGTWAGRWGGYSSYPATRPVDPRGDFVPGGPHRTPEHEPNDTYPGAPIDPCDDVRGIIHKKLRDATEKVKEKDLPEDGKDCSICYTPFWEKPEAGDLEAPVKLRSCGHVFGESCLNEWVQTNNSCPSCRKEFPVVKAT